MKKAMKKKIAAFGLACLMTAGMQSTVFADDTAAVPTVEKVTKYFEMAEGLAVPSVTFSFTAEKVTEDAPGAEIGDLSYTNADAMEPVNGLSGIKKEADITFGSFPHDGLYEYTVSETAGTPDNGVTYDTGIYDLKVYVSNEVDGTLKVQSMTAEKGGTKQDELSFINTYRKDCSLEISKTTTGSMADKTKDFDFTIKFERSATENDAVDSYTGKIGNNEKSFKVGEETNFKLHDGEKLVFDSLPAGTRYVVKEAAVEDGYTPSIKVVENGVMTTNTTVSEREGIASAENGTNLVGENTNSVAFTNTYQDVPVTGILLNNWSFVLLIALAAGAMLLSKVVKVRERKE